MPQRYYALRGQRGDTFSDKLFHLVIIFPHDGILREKGVPCFLPGLVKWFRISSFQAIAGLQVNSAIEHFLI
jgi:hypothetical protein